MELTAQFSLVLNNSYFKIPKTCVYSNSCDIKRESLDGFSLANNWSFAKFYPRQTFPLYGIPKLTIVDQACFILMVYMVVEHILRAYHRVLLIFYHHCSENN